MRKNTTNILALLLLLPCFGIAQQLTPFVISSTGGFHSNPSGMLSYTTGEMTSIETFTSPANILTQGFQQVWDFGTYINEHPDINFSFGIHPNPTDGIFKLITESPLSENVSVRILDVLGREIYKTAFYHQNNIHIEYFDLSTAVQGIYFITLTVEGDNLSGSTRHFTKRIHVVKP